MDDLQRVTVRGCMDTTRLFSLKSRPIEKLNILEGGGEGSYVYYQQIRKNRGEKGMSKGRLNR